MGESGAINLDSAFTYYLKGTQFKNEVGNDITVKNLIAHSSGLGNPSFTFRLAYSGLIDEKGLATVLSEGTLVRTKPGNFQYTNLGYNIYAYILESYLHKNWKNLLKEKILNPLNMSMTTAYISVAKQKKWNMAAPYDSYGKTGSTRIRLTKTDNVMHSAGGMVSTVNDLSKWLQMQLNDGVLKNRRVFSNAVINKSRTPYTLYERFQNPFGLKGAYALGLQKMNIMGRRYFPMRGAILGFVPIFLLCLRRTFGLPY